MFKLLYCPNHELIIFVCKGVDILLVAAGRKCGWLACTHVCLHGSHVGSLVCLCQNPLRVESQSSSFMLAYFVLMILCNLFCFVCIICTCLLPFKSFLGFPTSKLKNRPLNHLSRTCNSSWPACKTVETLRTQTLYYVNPSIDKLSATEKHSRLNINSIGDLHVTFF